MSDPRPPLRSQRVPPASQEYGIGLTANLKELLARSGLHECLQFYGHHFYGTSEGVAEGPMTEELLVYALGESERKRPENQEKVRRLTIALDVAGEALRAATARAFAHLHVQADCASSDIVSLKTGVAITGTGVTTMANTPYRDVARFCGICSDFFTNISQLGAHTSCLYTENPTLNDRNQWEG
jgi:hypothetical protein